LGVVPRQAVERSQFTANTGGSPMNEALTTVADPLLYNVPLKIQQTFYPMGFPVKLHTNSEQIHQAALEAWGQDKLLFPEEAIQLRFAVEAGNQSECPPARLPRAQGNLYSAIHSADNYAIADFSRGFAYGWFTPVVIGDLGRFRYHFLEAVTYAMLSVRYLTPIHAACVGLRGAGLLLSGPSGAGKTSLAYACARRGWQYITDDGSYLVRKSPDSRLIVGRPHHIRFRESARTLFAELAARESCRRVNGKMDIEIPSAEAGIQLVSSQIQAAAIVFLNRDGGSSARLRHFSKERARELLNQSVLIGEELERQAQRESIDRFLEIPALELTYSGLEDAERSLRSFLEEKI